MSTTLGVVGPGDLVPMAVMVAEGLHLDIIPKALTIGHEHEVPKLLQDHAGSVDGWLLVGVSARAAPEVEPHHEPWALATDGPWLQGTLDGVPVRRVEPGTAELLAVLACIMRHQEIPTMSVDTVPSPAVRAALLLAGLPGGVARVFDVPGAWSGDLHDFHDHSVRCLGFGLAVTGRHDVWQVLRGRGIETVWLPPGYAEIRQGIESLWWRARERLNREAQLALAYVESPEPKGLVEQLAAQVGGTLYPIGTHRYVLVTTRGQVEEASQGLRTGGFLPDGRMHVGFGLSTQAQDCEKLAKQALTQAKLFDPPAATVALSSETCLVFTRSPDDSDDGDDGAGRHSGNSDISLIATRCRMRLQTVESIRDIARRLRDDGREPEVTARDLSEMLEIGPGNARRMIARLARVGAVKQVGSLQQLDVGRPSNLYRIQI